MGTHKRLENKINTIFSVYGLFDPETQQLRYIGQTYKDLHKRLLEHIKDKKCSYKRNWIKSLINKNLKPIIDTLEICETEEELNEAEEWHIQYWRSLGCELTNQTSGGRIERGYKPSRRIKTTSFFKIKRIFQ